MVEQVNIETIMFENARKFHENYLINFHEQDLQDAIQNYVEVLTINPEKSECYYRLASLMYETGQITLESTIEQCQKAIALNPENVNAYLYAGYYLEQAEDFSSAEKFIKKAIKLSRFKSARARLLLASSFKKKFEYSGFNLLNRLNYLYYFLTGVLSLCADKSAIKMIYKFFSDEFKFKCYVNIGNLIEKFSLNFALKFYNFAMSKTQKHEFFFDKIAQIYLKNDDYINALNCYNSSLKINSENKYTIAQLAKVTQTYLPDKIDKIIDYYTLLLELEDEDLSPIYYELGHLYLQKEDKINSVAAFKLALDGHEDNPYYNDALAYAYVQAELYDDAIEYYQKAIKLNPDRLWTVNVCYTLGVIYQKCKENYEAAIASFQAGAILDPLNENILIALADVYSLQKDYDLAIKTYKDVIDLNKNNFEALSKLGIAYCSKKQTDLAINSYNEAIRINPKYEISYNNLAVIYLEDLKDYDKALYNLNKALELNPNYTFAYFNKGRVLEATYNFNEAAQCYQMAIYLNKITEVLDENEINLRMNKMFNV